MVSGVISGSIATTIEDCLAAKTAEIQLSVEQSVANAMDASVLKLSTDLKEAMVNSSPSLSGTEAGNSDIVSSPRSNPTNHIEDYIEEFLTEEEVLETQEAHSQLNFAKVNGREVASFGESYSYSGAPKNNVKEIPEHIQKLIDKLNQNQDYQDLNVNQVVVNKYTGSDSFLPEHSDNEASIKLQSKILIISIGSERNILFKDKHSGHEIGFNAISGSLYAMNQESQHHWTHRIDKEEAVQDARYSITLRTVGSNFKNSTVILGDSNTKYLKFGTGQQGEKGTFGYRLPGKRVETFHIKDVDASQCIGYQNVLIHCGINDLRDKSPGRQPDDAEPTDVEAHISLLIQKINEIKASCPYSSIFISPLLPTKNIKLNNRVVRFNSLLFDFVSNHKDSEGVQCLNFSQFVDHGVLKEDLGTWDVQNSCFNKKDILHLGKTGIRLLAKVIKDHLLHKKVTTRSYRDTLSRNAGV